MATDPARAQTDAWLKEIERRIRREYAQAQKEITAQWDAYMKDGEKKLAALYDAYVNAPPGKKAIAKQKYQQALQNFTLRNKQFKEMEQATAYRLSHVNQIAIDYVNGRLPDIYAINYNYKDPMLVNYGIDFTLIDEDTLRRMITQGEVKLPRKKLNIPKDMQWNRNKMNSAILQGILQGESMKDIAKRLLPIIGQNENAAIRNARTLVTGAENGGRNDRYKRLESEGVVMYKMWIATGDGRTRDWHLSMDGQEVPADDAFIDGLGNELEYPGDPDAEPETVYNCFVGDTQVTANTDIIRTYKHSFDGDLITIKTAGGVQFTCTPNHPILTLRGWISANALNNGDNILVTFACDNRIFGFDPNIKHIFTRFDTLHKFGNECITERATNLNVNFHGDVPASDVEIVTKKSFLRGNGDSCGSKGINKFLLESSDMPFTSKRTFMQHFRRVWLSTFSVIRRKCKTFSFLWRSLIHAKIHGLRPIAWGDTQSIKPIKHNGTRHAKILSKLLNGFAGIICVDKIISIDIKFSHCDVFNLQSENGYYFVNSSISQSNKKGNDIVAIVKNCRCSMRGVPKGIRGSSGKITWFKDYSHHGLHQSEIKDEKERRGM